jgi:hypothetical protein
MTSIRDNSIWGEMLTDFNSRVVNFSDESIACGCYSDDTTFEPEMLPSVPRGWQIIVLFPWQTDDRKVLFSDQYSTLSDFNIELNARLHRESSAPQQVVVCWTDYIYKIQGVTGSLYVAWAREISIYKDRDNEIDKMRRDIPLLVNTDGEYGQKAFYPLMSGLSSDEVRFLSPDRVRFTQAVTTKLYPCDRRPAKPHSELLKKLDADEIRVRRERVTIPAHEVCDYHTTAATAPLSDGLGYFVSSSVAINDGYREYATPVVSDDDNDTTSIPDDIGEFFAVGLSTPHDIEGDVAQSMIAMTFDQISSSSTDGEAPILTEYVSPGGALTQRNRVPRSLVPRSEHRGGATSIARVRFVPKRHSPVLPRAKIAPPPPEGITPLALPERELS